MWRKNTIQLIDDREKTNHMGSFRRAPAGAKADEERVNGERVRVSHPPAIFSDAICLLVTLFLWKKFSCRVRT